jgi:hypothetical protein
MSVSAVTNVFSSYAQAITGSTGGAPSTAASSASALQEASETTAQTKTEAAHGDKVAKAKLLRQQQHAATSAPASAPSSAPAPSEAGKGRIVDKAA